MRSMAPASLKPLNVLFADDDRDDRFFFEKALKEIPIAANLVTVPDGEELMTYLAGKKGDLPDVLFLDLNMPRKTGFECLAEIKQDKTLKAMSIVILSTAFPMNASYEQNMINMCTRIGADDFIRKPSDISMLREALHKALIVLTEQGSRKGKASKFTIKTS